MRNLTCLSAAALGLLLTPVAPALAEGNEKPGSAYVQCDGQPDNVTDGETAARLIGAITLLGLFAPAHEAADPGKRKFGTEGVAACTSLLSGEHQESNARRRLGLILGRAIHQIEAKNYDLALSDVAMARREAEAAGLMSDPYFVRSRGRAFDAVEAAALVRMSRVDEARSASLRHLQNDEYSFCPLFSASTYDSLIETSSPDEERVSTWRTRLFPFVGSVQADRLELAGHFADSARIRDAMVEFDAVQSPELNSSILIARSALAHALTGDSRRPPKGRKPPGQMPRCAGKAGSRRPTRPNSWNCSISIRSSTKPTAAM